MGDSGTLPVTEARQCKVATLHVADMLLVWIRTTGLRLSLTRVEMNLAYPLSSPTRIRTNSEKTLHVDAESLRLLHFLCLLHIQPIRHRQRNQIHPLRLLLISMLCLHFCSALHMRCHLHHGHHAIQSTVSSLTPIVPTQPPRAGESSLSAQSTSVSPSAPQG